MPPMPSDYEANISDSQETRTSTTARPDAYGRRRHGARATRMKTKMKTKMLVLREWNATQKDSLSRRPASHFPAHSPNQQRPPSTRSRPQPRLQAPEKMNTCSWATKTPRPAQSHSSPARRSGLNSPSPRRSALPTAVATEALPTSKTMT